MTVSQQPSEIFDRRRRRILRDRFPQPTDGSDFLSQYMARELLERLDIVTRKFSRALVIGSGGQTLLKGLDESGISTVFADPGYLNATSMSGVQCDEDRLPFADNSFDLILSVGMFDSINDLPGSLTLMQRVLRPDGLLLGAFLGAGSLTCLKESMMAADAEKVIPHVHPQIDVRATGDLLLRAGLALPVVDGEQLNVRYSHFFALVTDLRVMAATNMMIGQCRPYTKTKVGAAAAHFSGLADKDGKVTEKFEIVYMSAWAPDDSQPKPAQRGSGSVSLTAALKAKPD